MSVSVLAVCLIFSIFRKIFVFKRIHLEITENSFGCLGPCALFGGSGARFLVRNRSLEPSKNFSEAPEALRACFFARAGRFFARTGRPERSQARFSKPKRLFFRSLPMRRTLHAQSIRHRQNPVKTNAKRTSELPRIDRKSLQNRSRSACDCVWRRERPCERLENCPGGTWSVSGMPRRAFGQLLTALGSSGATQDRLWGSIWASKSLSLIHI